MAKDEKAAPEKARQGVPAPIPGVFDCPNAQLLSLAAVIQSYRDHLVQMDRVIDHLLKEKELVEQQNHLIAEELEHMNRKLHWLRCAKEQLLKSLG